MARRLTEADKARGKRLAAIREAIGITQEQMVGRLNAAALTFGLAARYRYYTVSRIESGSISFEDAAVWLSLAPASMKATWEWLVGVAPSAKRSDGKPPTGLQPPRRQPVPDDRRRRA